MCKHMNLLKLNTFISMRICAGWTMHLLSSKLNCSSSSGWMFLFMCRYSLCSVVYRFLWKNKRKKKFVSYYLFTMCKFQWITTNKTWKKWQTPQDFYRKDADQTVPPHNPMPFFIQPGMFYSFWHANSWLQNISLIVFNHFRPPYLVVTSENLLKSLIW